MYILISFMAKLISVADDVYSALGKLKGNESFSVIIRSLLTSKSNQKQLLSYAGKGGIDEKRIKDVKKEWNKWAERYA